MLRRNHWMQGILAGSLALGLAGGAHATALDGLFSPGEVLLTDRSGENVVAPDGSLRTGDIQEGDRLIGAAEIDTISSGGTEENPLAVDRELTALFQIEVTAMSDTGQTASLDGTTYEIWDFELGPAGATAWDDYLTAAEAADLGVDRDRMVAGFYDDAVEDDGGTDFSRLGSDSQQELEDASDGELRAVAGLDEVDDFWVARGPLNLQTFADANQNEDLGDFFFGASWLYEDFTAVNFEEFDQNTGSEALDNIFSTLDGANPGTVTVGLFGDGDLVGKQIDSDFGVWNKVDISAQAVPAPATLALTGLGLLGMGWVRRRSFPARV